MNSEIHSTNTRYNSDLHRPLINFDNTQKWDLLNLSHNVN